MIRTVLVLLAAAITLGSDFARRGDTVDFGAPPPAGLLFSRIRSIESTLEGRREVGEQGERNVQKLRQNLRYDENYTEKILRVEDGRVAALSRYYVTALTEAEVDTDRMPGPRKDQKEEAFAALDFYVEWKNGKASVQVFVSPDEQAETVESKKLVEPSRAITKALAHAFDHPHPLLPRASARQAVGGRWTVGAERISRFLPRAPAHPLRGSLDVKFASVRRDHQVTISTVTVTMTELGPKTIVEASEEVPIPCAVLIVKGAILVTPKNGLPLEISLEGTLLYSLKHHLIVHAELGGRQTMEGSAEGDRFVFAGTYKDQIEVEFHRVSAASEKVPKRPAGGTNQGD